MKFLTATLLLFSTLLLTAQIPVWTGETETTFQLADAQLLRYAPPLDDCQAHLPGNYQDRLMAEQYADRFKNLPTSVDTVIVFDPATKKQTVHIVRNVKSYSAASYTLRQRWELDGSGNLTVRTIAFQPIFNNQPNDAAFIDLTGTAAATALAESPLVYGAEFHHRLSDFQTLSGDLNAFVRHYYFTGVAKAQRPPMRNFFGENCDRNYPLSSAEVQQIFQSPRRDTIVTFDPKTFEQNMQVVETTVRPEATESLRTKQYLYWDTATGQLRTALRASGPVMKTNSTTPMPPAYWLAN